MVKGSRMKNRGAKSGKMLVVPQSTIVSKTQTASVSTTQTHATLGPAFMSHAMAIIHINTMGFSVTTLREVTKTQIQALQITFVSNTGMGGATNSLPTEKPTTNAFAMAILWER